MDDQETAMPGLVHVLHERPVSQYVSVPDIEGYSDLPNEGAYDQKGTTIMDNRYIRHEYHR